MPVFNNEFSRTARQPEEAFIPVAGIQLDDYLCEPYDRTANKDNMVKLERLNLQIPSDQYRHHYVRARVKVVRHLNQGLSVWHGPRKLANYNSSGELIVQSKKKDWLRNSASRPVR